MINNDIGPIIVEYSPNRTTVDYCSLAFIQLLLDFIRSEKHNLCTALFIGSRRFYVHALNSEHAKEDLNAYWLEWTEHVH